MVYHTPFIITTVAQTLIYIDVIHPLSLVSHLQHAHRLDILGTLEARHRVRLSREHLALVTRVVPRRAEDSRHVRPPPLQLGAGKERARNSKLFPQVAVFIGVAHRVEEEHRARATDTS